ncbi:glycosyltransferase family 2 protein, partial [Streptomyces griseoluteus]|uniref:glycosyltransferase family 2 protein n=1 Tax=Streptomyces griseoluteus TaxID=29306 RepID=UPI0036BAA10A
GALAPTPPAPRPHPPPRAHRPHDSWWEPGALRRAADLLDAHPRLGLVVARTLVGPEGTEDPLNTVLATSPLPPEPDLPGRPVLGFLACACVVRTDAFRAAGGFHPLLFFGGEETLLAYDLAARGWGVVYDPSLTARHHPAPAGRHGRNPRLWRNEVLTLWLRRPLSAALAASVRLAVAAATGRPGAAPALRELLARLPVALVRRHRLPPAVERAARLLDTDRAARARREGPA